MAVGIELVRVKLTFDQNDIVTLQRSQMRMLDESHHSALWIVEIGLRIVDEIPQVFLFIEIDQPAKPVSSIGGSAVGSQMLRSRACFHMLCGLNDA
ncbi:MAG: hypothetical protein JWN70_1058 [Planctomycetaceae bacterium]|nr:hypothetical protein [Planctomycetaceae bacterium]